MNLQKLQYKLRDFLFYIVLLADIIKGGIKILHRHGKLVGLAGGMSERDISFRSEPDIDMIFAGADWCFVYRKGKETLDTMRKYFGGETR